MASGHAVVSGKACASPGATVSAATISIAVPITRILALPALLLEQTIALRCGDYEATRRHAQKNHRRARLSARRWSRNEIRRRLVEFFGRAAGGRQEAEKTVVAA